MANRIIRRRVGVNDVAIERSDAGTAHRTVRLESSCDALPMRDRVLRAVEAYTKTTLEDAPPLVEVHDVEEREDQEQILRNALDYLRAISQQLSEDPYALTARARLVAAARTGKTVLMIKMISRFGLRTVIIAPTGTIVEKTVEEIRKKLPGVSVGAYYGPSKETISYGVTVATYHTLVSHAKRGILPESITGAGLILCDEGHETMTENRQDALNVFSDQAIMIALTATPDYNQHRMLANYFPLLIDDIRLVDACARGQLAPTRVRVRAVRVQDSVDQLSVATVKGDFDGVAMGQALKLATVFQACLAARYEESSDHPVLKLEDGASVQIVHKNEKALICCPSVDFAHELLAFMRDRRPAGTPEPRIVVGDTSPEERRSIIAALRVGEIDTVINVGVLLRGFDDPSLKLLIDLSPTVSLVRAEQKFCRPCTKFGDRGAVIYLIYPYGLAPMPLLPTDIFGASFVGTADRVLTPRPAKEVSASAPREKLTDVQRAFVRETQVSQVTTVREFSIELKPPTFDPEDREAVRAVLGASEDFAHFLEAAQVVAFYVTSPHHLSSYDTTESERGMFVRRAHGQLLRTARDRLPNANEFRRFLFFHESFTGLGSTLLRFCKVPPGTKHFRNWLRDLLPELEIVLGTYEEVLVHSGAINNVGEYVEELVSNFDEFESDWRPLEEVVSDRLLYARVQNTIGDLSDRQHYVLERWVDGEIDKHIGYSMNLSHTRVAQIRKEALDRLRSMIEGRNKRRFS